MLKRLAASLFVLALVGCGGDEAGGSTPTTVGATTVTANSVSVESAIDWVADLETLDAGVRRLHPDPFWRVGEEGWNRRIEAARELLPTLGRRQAEMVFFELAALLDGHSGIYPSEAGYHFYGVRLYHFTDGYFLLDGPDPTAIGGELVAINGVPVADAVALVTPLIAHDNDKTIEIVVPMYLMIAEILEGTGIVADPAEPQFDVQRADGTHAILNPGMSSWDDYIEEFDGMPVGLPQADEPLSQSRRNDRYWWTMVGDVLYFQFNQVVRGDGDLVLRDLVTEVRERLALGDVRRVVVDVRHNNGGDYRSYAPLKDLLLGQQMNLPDGVYVIIGRHTFSAATLFVTELEAKSEAIVFVGEPTGGSPNLFADVRPVNLLSSGLTVNVSSGFYDLFSPGDSRPWIAPDIAVELSSADYFAGVDPVLQAAIDS